MRKDIKYISLLVLATVIYVVMEIITPKTIDWTVTLASMDKKPFGAYLINQRMGDLFKETSKSNLTIYELVDSSYQNLFVLAQVFEPDKEDLNALLTHVDSGNNVLIVAGQFYGKFADTLGINTTDYLFQGNIFKNINEKDTAELTFASPSLANDAYYYQRNNAQYYFNRFDSLNTVILGENDLERPNFIKVPWGKGDIFLCSTPLAFTNNYMVYKDNNEYASKIMSYLPSDNIHWTEFYQLGRMEARTPLRFILSNESLRWAYYIAILTLLFFMFFEAKRKQRIIPVIEPLKNETLSFIGTIGNLYYQNKAHKSIALKKINFFMDKLRRHYYLSIREGDADFVAQVAHKTGNDEEDTRSLFTLFDQIKQQPKISEQQLTTLNKKIEDFKFN